MSRIGKLPVRIPSGVSVGIEQSRLRAKGPLGELFVEVPHGLHVTVVDGEVRVAAETAAQGPIHGLTRTLVSSAVLGVSKGFSKALEIVGVGYRAELKGKNLVLQLGHSHPHVIEPPAGVSFEVPEQTRVVVKGCDRQSVGQMAADIRGLRPPEPYKGKGIKYVGEVIRRKAGKTAAG
ncbi:MAG: 50S ribosomal protein L6 [bacterium]